MGHGNHEKHPGIVQTYRPQLVELSEADQAICERVVDLTFGIGREYKERGADVPVTYEQSKTFILAAATIVAAECGGPANIEHALGLINSSLSDIRAALQEIA